MADLTSGEVIAGGAGVDTLAFTTTGAIAAVAFKGVNGIDVLRLAKGTNTLTLDEAMVSTSDKDRLTIAGATGSDTVNASAVSGGVVVFNGGDTSRTTFTAGAVTVSATGGSGADTFRIAAVDLTSGDVIAGGAGVDTLAFTTAGAIAPAAFAGVSRVDVLRLALGSNRLTLSEALLAGSDSRRLTVYGGAGTDTVDASAVTSGAVVFEGASTTRTVFEAGAGVVSATGGSGADLFEIGASNLTSADSRRRGWR